MAPFVSPAFIAPPVRTAAPEPRVDLANPREVPLQLPGTPSPVESPLGGGDETGFPLIPGKLLGPLGEVDFNPLAALANFWSGLNRPQVITPGDWLTYDESKPLTSNTHATWTISTRFNRQHDSLYCYGPYPNSFNESGSPVVTVTGTQISFIHKNASRKASCPNNTGSGFDEGWLRVKVTDLGNDQIYNIVNGGAVVGAQESGEDNWTATVTGVRKDGVDLTPEGTESERYPLERRFTNPSPATLAPQPLPLPQPGPSPRPAADPATEPLPETAPSPPPLPVRPDGTPGTSPSPYPVSPPTPSPVPVPGTVPNPQPIPAPSPGTVPIGPDGLPQPQPLPQPVPTPGDQTQVGVIVIPGTGPAPRPDLEGIATEVGKIERKLEVMMLRDAFQLPESPPPDFSGLETAIQEILAILNGPYGSGSYQLVAPCQEGVTAAANWLAGAGQFERLSVQMDALAELLQAHKDQRQPVCATKASGQPVTVQFLEIG